MTKHKYDQYKAFNLDKLWIICDIPYEIDIWFEITWMGVGGVFI